MAKLKEEFFKLLPPTIFFFVALHILMDYVYISSAGDLHDSLQFAGL